MHQIKSFIAIFDVFFTALWGVCLIDLMPLAGVPTILPYVDVWIQKAVSFVGLVGFLMRLYNYWQNAKIARDMKRTELEMQQEELRQIKFENKQKEKAS